MGLLNTSLECDTSVTRHSGRQWLLRLRSNSRYSLRSSVLPNGRPVNLLKKGGEINGVERELTELEVS